jgi:hypothetical protein
MEEKSRLSEGRQNPPNLFKMCELEGMPLARLERATHGLGIHCSIRTELQGHQTGLAYYIAEVRDFQSHGRL